MSDKGPRPGDCRVLDGAFACDPDDPERVPYYFSDITLRDLFAGFALAGLLADRLSTKPDTTPGKFADGAYTLADAMLKERAK